MTQDVADRSRPPDIILSLLKIHCAACISKIERVLLALPEVDAARVNLSLIRVTVHYVGITSESVVEALQSVGYGAHPLDARL